MRAIFALVLCVAAAAAVPSKSQRIIGGSAVESISEYPSIASLLFSVDLYTYSQACGGTILNTRSILTAAHCVSYDTPNRWRVRVGSIWANSGGTVHSVVNFFINPNFQSRTLDSDIAIVRTTVPIVYVNNAVQAAFIAGANYNVGDNQIVWAAGWGVTTVGGPASEQLNDVQMWSVNQRICEQRYETYGYTITPNMLCAGYLDVGGRDQCQGDDGGPLYHNSVVVGVASWSENCGLAYLPGVNTRVSSFTAWIQATA